LIDVELWFICSFDIKSYCLVLESHLRGVVVLDLRTVLIIEAWHACGAD